MASDLVKGRASWKAEDLVLMLLAERWDSALALRLECEFLVLDPM